jgi:hypothetical protein
MSNVGLDRLDDDLQMQIAIMAERVPAYARVLETLRGEIGSAFGQRLAELWAGRVSSASYERPLLILASLRYDALRNPDTHPLARAIAHEPPDASCVDAPTVRAALADARASFWDALATRAVQTNETSRAVTWLWPASLLRAHAGWSEMTLVDLGTSAGLNLIADALPFPWRDASGAALVLEPRPRIVQRLGLDRSPLDVRSDDTLLWLRACVWPGDRARQERLSQAAAAFRAAAGTPEAPALERCELPHAGEHLDALPAGVPVLAVQTIVRDYLSPELREQHQRNLHAWLSRRAPLRAAWAQLELQPGGTSMDDSAAITLTLLDSRRQLQTLTLARCHPHPNRILVDTASVQALGETATRRL